MQFKYYQRLSNNNDNINLNETIYNADAGSLKIPSVIHSTGQVHPSSTRTGSKRFTFDHVDIQFKKQ
jgi:hypothetical protein